MADQEDVNTTEAEESSTSAETDVNSATESSTDASAEDAGSQSSESTAQEAVPTREALIAQLTGKAKSPDEDVEEVEEETEPEKSDEAAEATEVAKAETKSEPALTDEEINAPLGKEGTKGARERIQSLLRQRKEREAEIDTLKPHAEFGRALGEIAAAGGLKPDQLGAWIALAAEVNKDPDKSAHRFYAEAERIAKERGIQLPKTVETVIPAEIDAIEEMILADALDGNLSGDVAKKYLEKVRSAKKAGKTVPPPTAVPEQKSATQHATQTPIVPAQPDPAIQNGQKLLADTQAKLAKKYSTSWDTIQKAVLPRLSKYAGARPENWGALYEQEVESYIRETAPPVKKAPSNQPLRPTTQTTVTKPPTGKLGIISELTGKK